MRTTDVAELADLAEPLRSRATALLQAAADQVWIVSGRRSSQEQVALRQAHCGRSFYDVWQKPASQCSPPTAIPGRSKHETGLAVDLGGDLSLAARLASKVGLKRTVPGEAWHFEPDPAAAGYLGLAGIPVPPGVVVEVGKAGAEIFGQVEEALADVVGAAVEPALSGLRRIALVGVLIAGGVALVVLGGIRTQTDLTKGALS